MQVNSLEGSILWEFAFLATGTPMLRQGAQGVATVSPGSIKVSARSGEVCCSLGLVTVVTAETEAAAVTKARGEEVGPGEAGGLDFVKRRRKFHPCYRHRSPRFLLPLDSPYESDKLGGVRHRPSKAVSTA
ncbi:hypothetical protein PUN28_007652 [Cardiocondyla obscurior]|uniref:Uncharacterized protein n=1 Tax=Cardiocondyla obscurior TaxID=286306 RepID=A0AAW2G6J3_9HYME